MKGDFYCYPGKISIKTEEGVACINETIKYLLTKQPLKPRLTLDRVLCKVAQKHADDIGKSGMANHTGTYNMTPTERAKEYGYETNVYENLSFGNYDSPLDCILNLLIDDGVK